MCIVPLTTKKCLTDYSSRYSVKRYEWIGAYITTQSSVYYHVDRTFLATGALNTWKWPKLDYISLGNTSILWNQLTAIKCWPVVHWDQDIALFPQKCKFYELASLMDWLKDLHISVQVRTGTLYSWKRQPGLGERTCVLSRDSRIRKFSNINIFSNKKNGIINPQLLPRNNNYQLMTIFVSSKSLPQNSSEANPRHIILYIIHYAPLKGDHYKNKATMPWSLLKSSSEFLHIIKYPVSNPTSLTSS